MEVVLVVPTPGAGRDGPFAPESNGSFGVKELRVRRTGWLFALALLLAASTGLAADPASGARRWRVLLLQDSDPFLSDSLPTDQAFRAAMIEGSDRPIDFIREWSGSERTLYFDSDAERLKFLRGKYRRFAIDLIVSLDESGLEFAHRHRGELSEADAKILPRPAGTAGVVLAADVTDTLELALALQPQARRLVVVDGLDDSDNGIRSRVRESLGRIPKRLDTDFLTAEPLPALFASLRHVPRTSIVLHALSDRDSSRLSQRTRDLVRRISEASAAPVYTLRETGVGQGVVGGVTSSLEDHGRQAATLALRVLAGHNPDTTPITVTRPHARADWLQLRRWELDEARLPADTDLRNVGPKPWQPRRWQVVAAAIVVGLLTAVILPLLLWRAERRGGEDQLRKRVAFEGLLSEVSASVMDVSHDGVHEGVERSLARVVESMQLERCALFVLRPGQKQARISHVARARGVRDPEIVFGGELLAPLRDALRVGIALELDAAGKLQSGSGSSSGENALLVVPVSAAGDVLSGILLQASGRNRAWPAETVSRMLLIGQILLSAITRRGAETSLRASEEKYRTVVDSQSDLICRYLPDTTLTFVNEAYCRYFGLTRDELIGRRSLDLVPERSREPVREHIQSLIRNPRVDVDEHEVLRPDGSVGWLQWSEHAIFGRDGRIVEFQGIGRDITDRKRAQEAESKLATAARLTVLGELATSIAHEIRQPLGAILANAETAQILLESGLQGEGQLAEIRTILADIHREDLRASQVIQHIRSLMQHRPAQMEPLDVNDVVHDVVRFVTPDARDRRMVLDLDLSDSLPPVYGDQVQLQQVLLNLVVNGMDAMAEIPEPLRRLRIKTSSKDEEVVVEVRDAGHGISADVLPRLFQSFVTTRRDGLGLGLSLSRSIMESHGGRITADNNTLRGATFRCVLPAWAATRDSESSAGRIA
jgi:PAS domain S-box-containing protein